MVADVLGLIFLGSAEENYLLKKNCSISLFFFL
jgi:hypothetical protein